MKKKQYVRINHYGKLLIPVDLLERVASECYICETTYDNGQHQLTKIEPIRSIELHDHEEVETAMMYDTLGAE